MVIILMGQNKHCKRFRTDAVQKQLVFQLLHRIWIAAVDQDNVVCIKKNGWIKMLPGAMERIDQVEHAIAFLHGNIPFLFCLLASYYRMPRDARNGRICRGFRALAAASLTAVFSCVKIFLLIGGHVIL